ncbi:putative tRNA-splicing endonuclease subunit sen-2 [Echria macrotheca]|uniref:tRNA-intron lyase n=1 Tax=Echria macrotheca TaxID=438768 RepID=A0AAJ0FB92_9PEZI|nr:putative tRNA-splicing endonuclease subunit sen-2 [Echria macrotheca]
MANFEVTATPPAGRATGQAVTSPVSEAVDVPASATAPRPAKPTSTYLPVPVRTFPLPSFYPNNPVSLLHLAYAWLSQVFFPPAAEPSVVHIGIWDPETRSVRVDDPKSIRVLWEQGFFGKGSLSRSEPNWLKRELSRRGAAKPMSVSEQRTESRREARRVAKWERAKAELEALEQQRLEEAGLHAKPTEEDRGEIVVVSQRHEPKAPVGPAELLALPNSLASLVLRHALTSTPLETKPPVGPAELLALPNSLVPKCDQRGPATASPQPNGLANNGASQLSNGHALHGLTNGVSGHVPKASASHENKHASQLNGATNQPNGVLPPRSEGSNDSESVPALNGAPTKLARRKSVRFSPTVESTTFQHHDPPSPGHSSGSRPRTTCTVTADEVASPAPESTSQVSVPEVPLEVQNKEHYQLAPIEAFFLVFALGSLSVVDPVTLAPIPTESLLTLFRAYSYFPPLDTNASLACLRPQDPFLVEYAVYHHFRSLGWVPRHGIKFGVDLLLYERGPAWNHSHLGAIILPSFSHQLWKEVDHQEPKRTWSWLMGVNRVLAHVLKGLVLVYVDIPPPSVFERAMEKGGISAALKEYTVREVMVRRFSVNRNR